MCIILVKPAGSKLPKQKYLDACFEHNKDGFGLAYVDGEDVVIKKGGMTKLKADELIRSCPDLTDKDAILHWRISTGGGINAGNCHPFPLTTDEQEIKTTELRTKLAIAHNGIITHSKDKLEFEQDRNVSWYDWSYNATHSKQHDTISDTQWFILTYLAPLGQAVLNPAVFKMLDMSNSGKFAILTPAGISMVGRFVKFKGVYFSNNSYEPRDTYSSISSRKNPYTLEGVVNNGLFRAEPCELCGFTTNRLFELYGHRLCKDCALFFPSHRKYPAFDTRPQETCGYYGWNRWNNNARRYNSPFSGTDDNRTCSTEWADSELVYSKLALLAGSEQIAPPLCIGWRGMDIEDIYQCYAGVNDSYE